MMTQSHTIQEIAEQFDRICPSQVDSNLSGNGQREAGHVGHEAEDGESYIVGWSCAGGNVGHSVCEIPADCLDRLHERLASLPDGSLDGGGIEEIVVECGGEWVV